MSRLKPFIIVTAVAVAIASFIRTRLSDASPTDPGGWKPVDPS